MLLDFDVRSCSRSCVQTGRALEPGEVYFSVLEMQETETVRLDYSVEGWPGPPADSVGWWRSRVPVKDEKPRLAPVDVMLNLFAALADNPADTQFRYVLGLLLIRRRVLRREESTRNKSEHEVLTLHAPRRDQRYELVVDEPDEVQAEQIQQRMIDLLYGNSDNQCSPAESNLETDAK